MADTHSGYAPRRMERAELGHLIDVLQREGREVVGPIFRNQAIDIGPITTEADLPIGCVDEQERATYRLTRNGSARVFGFSEPAASFKPYIFPQRQRIAAFRREGRGFVDEHHEEPIPRLALFGVRACDLAAIAILDRILLEGPYVDESYRRRRESCFIVAVNCAQPGGTCFCASTQTGPNCTFGYDLVLTELHAKGNHRFLIEAGSPDGLEILEHLELSEPTDDDIDFARRQREHAADSMGREMNVHGLTELLNDNTQHSRWDDVASRCFNCTNCTLVCPTCFCATIEDTTSFDGKQAERWKRWDSCFTLDHSYVHGGAVRVSSRARYRQWLTHKFGTWKEQFGMLGCVGCGRCITWCPAGIDVVEEIEAIRGSDEKVREEVDHG